MSDLIAFYRGFAPDGEGRTLREIWSWNDSMLELVHDYIQWLFPLDTPSAFNDDAPLMDALTIAVFKIDGSIHANLRRSFQRMLQFYGFAINESDSGQIDIARADDYALRKEQWLNRGNHNYLRITRILRCLMLSGLEKEARAFFRTLEDIYVHEETAAIGDETYGFWREAAGER